MLGLTWDCRPRGEVLVLSALFMVPLLDTGIGIGIGEVALGTRRCCDKGEALPDGADVNVRSARSGNSRDFFLVRRERCGWWGLGDGECLPADDSMRLADTGEGRDWFAWDDAVLPIVGRRRVRRLCLCVFHKLTSKSPNLAAL